MQPFTNNQDRIVFRMYYPFKSKIKSVASLLTHFPRLIKAREGSSLAMSAWVHGKYTVCHYIFIRRFLAPVTFSYCIFSLREVFSSSCLLAAPSSRLHLPNTVKKKERKKETSCRLG